MCIRDRPWIELRSTEAFNLKWAEIEVRSQAFLFNLGDASRIEVCSTESRCETPWIDVCSTEAFNLNWGDAQTWLGQLLVYFIKLNLSMCVCVCVTSLYKSTGLNLFRRNLV